VEANVEEPNLKAYEEVNPKAVQPNIFKPNTDKKIFFPIEESEDTLLRSELSGVKLLEYVKLVQQSWVVPGMSDMESPVKNNVSNTVDVPSDQWDAVRDWVWENQNYIAGVTFLSTYGDMDLPQAPMCKVLSPEEILREYGVGSMFASGLVVDTIEVFGDLWKACEAAQGRGEQLFVSEQAIDDYIRKNSVEGEVSITDREHVRSILSSKLQDKVDNLAAKRDIVRRIEKFAHNYYRGDLYKAVNLLKSVNNLHLFELLKKTYKPVDWKSVDFTGNKYTNADELGAQSCAGGACEIK
jgi:ATP-cone domain protein